MSDDFRTVAIIDDDPAVLDAMRFLIELTGRRVAVYSSAVAYLADDAARPACLIVDQHMPQMTGLELVARMRAAQLDVPVLLITSAPSPTIIAHSRRLGVLRVLEKPPATEALLGFVAAHP